MECGGQKSDVQNATRTWGMFSRTGLVRRVCGIA
jgi:hypothetical protein